MRHKQKAGVYGIVVRVTQETWERLLTIRGRMQIETPDHIVSMDEAVSRLADRALAQVVETEKEPV